MSFSISMQYFSIDNSNDYHNRDQSFFRYKVTPVAAKAVKNNKKVKSVVIGANVNISIPPVFLRKMISYFLWTGQGAVTSCGHLIL